VSAARAEAISAEEIRAKAARREAATTQASRLSGSGTDATNAARARKPVGVQKRPVVPVVSPPRRSSIALPTAALVAAAIGVGAYSLRSQEPPVIAREEQPRHVAKTVTVTGHRPSTSVRSVAAFTTDRKPALPAPEASTTARPIPAPSAPTRGTVKTVRPPIAAPRPVALVSIPIPAIEVPARAIAPLAPDVIATAPPSVPPSLPVGRFFETMDVTELPRVARRVEPQVPDELRTRPLNEVVIVRVLISQGGHPSRISLLRRSRAGSRLDNAVIAAVNQWTFSPATRKGEAVSCWFNFGVPVGNVD
jgi:TonB family protein